MPKRKLVDELVAQELCNSQDEAKRLILAGDVYTSDRLLTHAGELVEPGLELHIRAQKSFVSRGGQKLEGALENFNLDVSGLTCLDVGASTGGFTHCLLERGAASVCALDVGYAQFDWGLRADSRVKLLERCDIKDYPERDDAEHFDMVVCDVSFTSIEAIFDAMLASLNDGGQLVCLVKPQFEAARDEVEAGGIVRSPDVHLRCLSHVVDLFFERGLGPLGLCVSPIKGQKGNIEFFIYGRRGVGSIELNIERCVMQGSTELVKIN